MTFPKVSDFDHVFCFNCKLKLSGPFQASGFADGHGAWRGQCSGQHGCGMITYFDVVENLNNAGYYVSSSEPLDEFLRGAVPNQPKVPS